MVSTPTLHSLERLEEELALFDELYSEFSELDSDVPINPNGYIDMADIN